MWSVVGGHQSPSPHHSSPTSKLENTTKVLWASVYFRIPFSLSLSLSQFISTKPMLNTALHIILSKEESVFFKSNYVIMMKTNAQHYAQF